MSFSIASQLSDAELVAEVKRLAGCERQVTVELITHLAEFESRKLHLSAGYPSLFAYCIRALCLSEDAAFNRIRAARAARRFPRILHMLGDGSLNLTTVRLLAPRLTAENQTELLAAAARKRRRAVEVLLARHFPQPDTPARIRKLPAPRAMPAGLTPVAPLATVAVLAAADPPPAPAALAAAAAMVMPPSVHRSPVTPLAPDRYRVMFTASVKTCDMMDLAKDMLRHDWFRTITNCGSKATDGSNMVQGRLRGARYLWEVRAFARSALVTEHFLSRVAAGSPWRDAHEKESAEGRAPHPRMTGAPHSGIKTAC